MSTINRQDAIDAIEKRIVSLEELGQIDRSKCDGGMIIGYSEAQQIIKALPSADAVEVVRCGECKHMIADGRCMEFADDGIRPSAADFCSYGERREDGE